jgi:NAD(P)H dehydrogenase (quinone)
MKIGITGAGGQLGTALLRYTLGRTAGSNIVAITRDPKKLDPFSSTGIDARAGDFSQPGGLGAAFHGVERLVIIPTTDLAPGVRIRQHSDAIDAAVAAGVQHIIYISTVSPRPDPDCSLFDSHFRTEQKLIATAPAWTILRMNVYTDTLVDPAKRAIASGTHSAVPGAPAAYVTRDDVAATAAGILATPGHAGITYHATGPVSIGQPEIVDLFAKASGKPVAFVEMTEAQSRQGLEAAGLPPFVVSAVFGFYAGLRAGAFDLVTGDVQRLSGRPATSPVEFLTRALKPA